MAGNIAAHLASGATTLARAWMIRRRDGATFGFTDHDRDLAFEGQAFRAGSGLTARALQQTTGLSVDNSEAMGALSDAALTEADILAGRFDAAEVTGWLVNWADPADRLLQFRGTLGEITRAGGAFQAELRGLTEALNQPQGRTYQRGCAAILGDRHCRVDTRAPGYVAEPYVTAITDRRVLSFAGLTSLADRWFEQGRLTVLSGAGAGLIGVVKNDRILSGTRVVELWEELGADVRPGDLVRLEAGCDRTAATCRTKFANFANFRGFPHIPGEDWLTAYPVSSGPNDGGSLRG